MNSMSFVNIVMDKTYFVLLVGVMAALSRTAPFTNGGFINSFVVYNGGDKTCRGPALYVKSWPQVTSTAASNFYCVDLDSFGSANSSDSSQFFKSNVVTAGNNLVIPMLLPNTKYVLSKFFYKSPVQWRNGTAGNFCRDSPLAIDITAVGKCLQTAPNFFTRVDCQDKSCTFTYYDRPGCQDGQQAQNVVEVSGKCAGDTFVSLETTDSTGTLPQLDVSFSQTHTVEEIVTFIDGKVVAKDRTLVPGVDRVIKSQAVSTNGGQVLHTITQRKLYSFSEKELADALMTDLGRLIGYSIISYTGNGCNPGLISSTTSVLGENGTDVTAWYGNYSVRYEKNSIDIYYNSMLSYRGQLCKCVNEKWNYNSYRIEAVGTDGKCSSTNQSYDDESGTSLPASSAGSVYSYMPRSSVSASIPVSSTSAFLTSSAAIYETTSVQENLRLTPITTNAQLKPDSYETTLVQVSSRLTPMTTSVQLKPDVYETTSVKVSSWLTPMTTSIPVGYDVYETTSVQQSSRLTPMPMTTSVQLKPDVYETTSVQVSSWLTPMTTSIPVGYDVYETTSVQQSSRLTPMPMTTSVQLKPDVYETTSVQVSSWLTPMTTSIPVGYDVYETTSVQVSSRLTPMPMTTSIPVGYETISVPSWETQIETSSQLELVHDTATSTQMEPVYVTTENTYIDGYDPNMTPTQTFSADYGMSETVSDYGTAETVLADEPVYGGMEEATDMSNSVLDVLDTSDSEMAQTGDITEYVMNDYADLDSDNAFNPWLEIFDGQPYDEGIRNDRGNRGKSDHDDDDDDDEGDDED